MDLARALILAPHWSGNAAPRSFMTQSLRPLRLRASAIGDAGIFSFVSTSRLCMTSPFCPLLFILVGFNLNIAACSRCCFQWDYI